MGVSGALLDWRSQRAERLNKLMDAHRAVAGTGRGRRWVTEELNHSLILRLASEFQGFSRDLHDETADVLINERLARDAQMATLVQALFEDERKIDRGNATKWSNVVDDFSRFGVKLKQELSARYVRYPRWQEKLAALNDARNAIAHNDRDKLAECETAQPLTLGAVHTWRSMLNQVASGMDHVIQAYLKQINGRTPW